MIVTLFGKSFIISLFFIIMLPFMLISNPYSKYEIITVDNHTVKAYIADDAISRSIGYMFRDPGDIAEDEGILFVYDKPVDEQFWMFNVHFPITLHTLSKNSDGSYSTISHITMPSNNSEKYAVHGQYFLEVKSQTI